MNTRESRNVAPSKKRILIVDDHPLTRRGLAQLITAEHDLTVSGEAGNTQEALAALKPPLPDLIVCDIGMPGRSGLEFIKDLKTLHPDVPVLVISMHDANLYAERVLRAGGNGYIMKSNGGGEVLEAIRTVLQGNVYLTKGMSDTLINRIVRGRSEHENTHFSQLTDREFEVFQLIGQGLSTCDIGKQLHISPKTVESHRTHIKEKFAMKNGAELFKHAVHWAATNYLT